MIILGTVVQATKFILLFAIAGSGNPVAFVLVLALQGAGYSLQFAGVVNFMYRKAHKDLRATYQSLYHTVFTLAGAGGSLVGSFVMQRFSSRVLMGYCGIVVLLSVAIFAFAVGGHGPETSADLAEPQAEA